MGHDTLRAPVPDKLCTVAALPSCKALLLAPNASFALNLQKSRLPAIPKYSYSAACELEARRVIFPIQPLQAH